MSESYVKVVLYDLTCDGTAHNRAVFAQADGADPEGPDYRSDDWETLAQAREAAARAGWQFKGQKAYCPRCAAFLPTAGDGKGGVE